MSKLYGNELLRALSDVFAPTANEDKAAELIIEQIGDDAEVSIDRVGNVIAKISPAGEAKGKVMFLSHMDEPGFIVKDIDGEGKVWFKLYGGVPTERISGRLGIIGGEVPCIFSAKPIHALSREDRTRATMAERIYAEIGAKNKESAEAKVKPFDMGTFAPSFGEIGNYIKGKALGNRAMCAALIELIRKIREEKCATDNELYFVFTTRGEIGGSGATVASYVIDPTRAVVLDGIDAFDTAGVPGEKRVSELGHGAVIMYGDGRTLFSRELIGGLSKYADENGVPYAYSTPTMQGGEGAAAQRTTGGCECVGISIPTRYRRSASEMICKGDYDAVLALAMTLI